MPASLLLLLALVSLPSAVSLSAAAQPRHPEGWSPRAAAFLLLFLLRLRSPPQLLSEPMTPPPLPPPLQKPSPPPLIGRQRVTWRGSPAAAQQPLAPGRETSGGGRSRRKRRKGIGRKRSERKRRDEAASGR
ncbi:Hypothetical predicted protein [Podarcis lilfordi]|uniref:Uncharacterized protein n=1 Tax=Podarcis lilfordi TaxID=74358 RepID=A0AA35PQV3_9SAUR|nr:Hypothetical predicted protein [Podarcis lilfordi]